MNEPFPRLEEPPEARKRGHVVLMAAVFSLLSAIAIALVIIALVKIVGGDAGFAIMLVVFGFLGLLFSFNAVQYLRDLNQAPTVLEGPISRKWHQGNLFVVLMPSFYISMEGKIFSVTKEVYGRLLETDDVRVHYYPHSHVVEQVERYEDSERKWVPADADY